MEEVQVPEGVSPPLHTARLNYSNAKTLSKGRGSNFFYQQLVDNIQLASQAGRCSVFIIMNQPVEGVKVYTSSTADQEAIQMLKEDGFQVDPVSGHPQLLRIHGWSGEDNFVMIDTANQK